MLMRPEDRSTGGEMGRCGRSLHPAPGRCPLPSSSSVGRRGFRTDKPMSAVSLQTGSVARRGTRAGQDGPVCTRQRVAAQFCGTTFRPSTSEPGVWCAVGRKRVVCRSQHATSHLVPNQVICHCVSLCHRAASSGSMRENPELQHVGK